MADASITRTRILNACRALLESDAGAVTRMSDVAKAAGVSRQAVYLHFKTRAELLIALTRHIDEVEHVEERLVASRSATAPPEGRQHPDPPSPAVPEEAAPLARSCALPATPSPSRTTT